MATPQLAASTSGTPSYLVPRARDLPTSNARYFQSAVITRVHPPPPASSALDWTGESRTFDSGGVLGRSIAFRPLTSTVFVGGAEGRLGRWDARTGEALGHVEAHANRIWSIGFSADGSKLASVGDDGLVRSWDPDTLTSDGAPLANESDASTRISFGYGALILARGGWASLLYPDGRLDRQVIEVPPSDQLIALRVAETSGRGALVSAAGGDGTVYMRTHGPVPGRPTFSGQHGATAWTVANTSDGSLVASGASDGSIQLWDPTNGERLGDPMIGDRRSDISENDISEVVFSPDGTLLASSDRGGRMRIWDVGSRRMLAEHVIGESRLWAIAFNGDGSIAAAAAEDGTIAVLTARETANSITGPLALTPPGRASSSARPSEGVLLTHEQSWTIDGIAYGELLHSVCLAPGEITQIAVSNASRSVLENSADTSSQEESLAQTGSSASGLDDSEHASATERSTGGSTATTASSSVQAGASGVLAGFGVSGGAAASASSAVRTSYMTSSRDISNETNQSVHQSALDSAELARRRHTAAVREVSESDSLELQTRVVANYNHMHALTIQYYAAIQLNRLRTRVVDARRMLFIPMRTIDFSQRDLADRAIGRYRSHVVAAARDAGLEGPATWIEAIMGNDHERLSGVPGLSLELRNDRLKLVWNHPAALELTLEGALGNLHDAQIKVQRASDAELRARDAIRIAPDDIGLADRAVLERTLRAEVAESDAARQRVTASTAHIASLRSDLSLAERRKRHLEEVLHGFSSVAPPRADDGAATGSSEAPADSDTPQFDEETFTAVETRVFRSLADNGPAVNRGIWMRIDPSEYAAVFEGATFQGERLTATLDPTPITVDGSHVGFRWNHPDAAAAKRFRDGYVGHSELEHSIPLPTGGLFGEAVLGESNSAEHLDLTRFWNWTDALPPIRPTQIDAIGQHDQQPLAAPTLPDVPSLATDLGPITFPTVQSGIPGLSEAMSKPDFFKDMSGTKAAAALAQSALQLSSDGSDVARDLSSSNYRRFLELQRKIAEQTLDSGKDGRGEELDATSAGAALNVARPPEQAHDERGSSNGGTGSDEDDDHPDKGGPVVEFVEEVERAVVAIEGEQPMGGEKATPGDGAGGGASLAGSDQVDEESGR